MRRVLFFFLVSLGVIFIVSNMTRFERASEAVTGGDWRVLLVAVAFVFIWLVNLGAAYRAIYRALGVDESLLMLFVLATASAFVNVVTPSGLLGGIALFADQANRRDYSLAKASLVGLLNLVFDLLAFMTVLIAGLFILFRRDDLTPAALSASAALALTTAFLLFLFILGMRSGEALSRVLGKIAGAINAVLRPLLKRDYVSVENAEMRGLEAANVLRDIRSNPKNLIWPYLLALNGKAILMVIFWLMFVAFSVPYSSGTIVAGFCIAFLFMVVSPSPAGIGFVEGLLPLTLNAMFVPLNSAVVITLAYRGMTFWLPMLLGILALRFIDITSRWTHQDGRLRKKRPLVD